MWRFLGVLALTGCVWDEAPATLADLGEVTLVMSRTPQHFEVTIAHDRVRPCPVLGDDFAAYVGGIELSTAPGEWNEAGSRQVDMYNNSPQPVPAHCAMPWIGGFELPSIKNAILTIGDHSAEIHCTLGDDLQRRAAIPVSGTWTMSRGERIEVKWFPVADLARATFTARFKLEGEIGYQATAPVGVDGDRLVFDVPVDGLAGGPLLLEIAATTAQTHADCGGVASTRALYDALWLPVEIRLPE